MTEKTSNWTRRDDAMVESMIRRGATRRDLLRMFMAGGMSLAAGAGARHGRFGRYPGDRRAFQGGGLVGFDRRYA